GQRPLRARKAGPDPRPPEGAELRLPLGDQQLLQVRPDPVQSMKNRGFTLIEVMVGAAVAILVIGVVMGTFLSQQRAMQTLDLSREASSAGRDALLSLQETIGRAGYGIDPRYAFDLRNYSCPAVPCRDKVDGPDELVFVER